MKNDPKQQPQPTSGTQDNAFTMPDPSQVKRDFLRLMQTSAEDAIRYLYDISVKSGYIRMTDIARNICWTADTACGPLEITINLSKPEKDPRDIAAALTAAAPPKTEDTASQSSKNESSDANSNANTASPETPDASSADDALSTSCDSCAPEPRCAICWENEGWPGSDAFPAKPLLRIAPITLANEEWGLQYSPYAYYPEHCIALSRQHRPMKVDAACFERLADFADQFPFYFIGSNAGLPIVGGSILNHDHFQGGRHEFPLMQASLKRTFTLPEFPDVHCGIVRWPASVIRLESEHRNHLLAAANVVLETWQSFSCPECSIVPYDEDGTPHSTVSPIMRKVASRESDKSNTDNKREKPVYIFDLALRNNRTTAERPWGLFHPRGELHHIKKENIGLIEVMGLAILPPRLARELPAVQHALHRAISNNQTTSELLETLQAQESTIMHAKWAIEVFTRRKADLRAEACADAHAKPILQENELSAIMQEEVGNVFAQVLEDTAVFRQDAAGERGWNAFLDALHAKR